MNLLEILNENIVKNIDCIEWVQLNQSLKQKIVNFQYKEYNKIINSMSDKIKFIAEFDDSIYILNDNKLIVKFNWNESLLNIENVSKIVGGNNIKLLIDGSLFKIESNSIIEIDREVEDFDIYTLYKNGYLVSRAGISLLKNIKSTNGRLALSKSNNLYLKDLHCDRFKKIDINVELMADLYNFMANRIYYTKYGIDKLYVRAETRLYEYNLKVLNILSSLNGDSKTIVFETDDGFYAVGNSEFIKDLTGEQDEDATYGITTELTKLPDYIDIIPTEIGMLVSYLD